MSVVPVQPGLSYAATGTRPEPMAVAANGGGGAAGAATATTAAAVEAAIVDPLIAALTEALATAAPRQNGLAPLFADLEVLLAQPDLPQAVRDAGQALLNLRLPGDVVNGPSLQQAIARSGMFLEAMLASGKLPTTASDNIKSALQALRGALQNYLGIDNAPADLHLPPPLPPFRGSLPVAQPPVPASIVDTGLRQAALKVLSQTDAAIARHVMLQIASLPASQQPSHPPDDHTQRLVFDIPLATPTGTAVMQLQIEREAPRDRNQPAPVWSVRFAVDVEPLGAVRARVSQIGDRTSVTMVADRPASAAALQQQIARLQIALTQANLQPGDLHCLSHEAPKASAPQGQFVNRAS
ncbi:MAG: flagellar hook-length control protein FliK [Proteobacteria bacterium]|nr:flagellar hook-length control protein FliK [Pseudomonadota bacterium]